MNKAQAAMNIEAKTLVVVDYGMGNLRSVSQAVQAAAQGSGWQVIVSSRPEDVRAAARIVLPGQGAMPDCMRELRQSGLRQVPHAGAVHPLWDGVPDNSYFYFVHSFYARPASAAHCAGEAQYGEAFAAAIARDNIFATQFHPEKSADQGLRLYRNFLQWNP